MLRMRTYHSGVRETLLRQAELASSHTKRGLKFTDDEEAEALIQDLEHHPHAYVLACLMDRRMKAERVWGIPMALKRRLGTFAFRDLHALDEAALLRAMREPSPLHRHSELMAELSGKALRHIAERYGGDAKRIWSDRPTSAALVFRFLEFEGIGPKIATMAANILVGDLNVSVADWYSIDVSVDSHVRRVMTRLGLVPREPEIEQVVYAARDISPQYPGLLDFALWEIGRNWCHPRRPPDCPSCPMKAVCPASQTGGSP